MKHLLGRPEQYKQAPTKDQDLWNRVMSLEKGTCERLKALKLEAEKDQQLEAQKQLSRGFER